MYRQICVYEYFIFVFISRIRKEYESNVIVILEGYEDIDFYEYEISFFLWLKLLREQMNNGYGERYNFRQLFISYIIKMIKLIRLLKLGEEQLLECIVFQFDFLFFYVCY